MLNFQNRHELWICRINTFTADVILEDVKCNTQKRKITQVHIQIDCKIVNAFKSFICYYLNDFLFIHFESIIGCIIFL